MYTERECIKVLCKWPTTIRNGGMSYTYETKSGTLGKNIKTNTPGFFGNSTFYKSVLSYYKNTSATARHVEFIDIRSFISSLLL